MKNKLLTGALIISLLGSAYLVNDYQNKLDDKIKQVEQLQGDVKTISAEIANLETVIVNRDNDLKASKQVIDKQIIQINKQNEELKTKIEELKVKNEEINKLKEQIRNFNSVSKGSDVGTFEMTSYIAMCREGCSGITATGVDVRNISRYEGHRIVATDPNVIPLWSIIEVNTGRESFTAIALDTGGAIKGKKLDFLVKTESEAIQLGRQNVEVTLLRKGK